MWRYKLCVMKKIILFRHRDADYLFDELTPEGVDEARALAEELRAEFEGKAVSVFTSHAGRTKHTATVIQDTIGLEGEAQALKSLEESAGAVGYSQGVGQHLPEDVDVAFCVTHAPVLKGFLPQRLGSLQGVDVTSDDERNIVTIDIHADEWPSLQQGL